MLNAGIYIDNNNIYSLPTQLGPCLNINSNGAHPWMTKTVSSALLGLVDIGKDGFGATVTTDCGVSHQVEISKIGGIHRESH